MEIKMSCTEVNIVLSVVLVLMEVKTSMDRVLVDGERVWHNIVCSQQVVSVGAGIVSLSKLGESGAEVGGLAAMWDLWDVSLELGWVMESMVNMSMWVKMVNIMMDIMVDIMVDIVVWIMGHGDIMSAETIHL